MTLPFDIHLSMPECLFEIPLHGIAQCRPSPPAQRPTGYLKWVVGPGERAGTAFKFAPWRISNQKRPTEEAARIWERNSHAAFQIDRFHRCRCRAAGGL